MQIKENLYVAMDYRLTIESGDEIDRSPAGEPLGFITGQGQIIPGLENALIGKKIGYSGQIVVEPEEGYGVVQQELFHDMPRDRFPQDEELKPEMTFQGQNEQGYFMLTVVKINNDDTVTVDLNHPLAGKRLLFDINIVEVREPLPEELSRCSPGCVCGTESGSECGSGCGSGCKCG